MTETEKLFQELFPDFCAGDKCLSPYFDIFDTAIELMEDKIEKLNKSHEDELDQWISRVEKLKDNLKKTKVARIMERAANISAGIDTQKIFKDFMDIVTMSKEGETNA